MRTRVDPRPGADILDHGLSNEARRALLAPRWAAYGGLSYPFIVLPTPSIHRFPELVGANAQGLQRRIANPLYAVGHGPLATGVRAGLLRRSILHAGRETLRVVLSAAAARWAPGSGSAFPILSPDPDVLARIAGEVLQRGAGDMGIVTTEVLSAVAAYFVLESRLGGTGFGQALRGAGFGGPEPEQLVVAVGTIDDDALRAELAPPTELRGLTSAANVASARGLIDALLAATFRLDYWIKTRKEPLQASERPRLSWLTKPTSTWSTP